MGMCSKVLKRFEGDFLCSRVQESLLWAGPATRTASTRG